MARVVPGAAAAPTNGAKAKAKRAAASANGAAASFEKKVEAPTSAAPSAASSSGRPDKAAHDASLAGIDEQINKLKLSQDDLRSRIAASDPKNGSLQEERTAIRAELAALREAQASSKSSRGTTLDQLKRLQAKVADKIKDLNAAKAKFPYKSVADIDAQIKSLERQVESGNMKIVDERKALNEISSLKKMRRAVDGFSGQQAAIEADRAAIDGLRAQLDDPEHKAAQDQFAALKAKLDALDGRSDEAHKGRKKLYDERDGVKKQLDEHYARRRELQAGFKAANDAYYAKVTDERNKRIERQRAERQAVEDAKRLEVNERLLDEASAPAYEREIEDCKTLIEYFSRGGGKAASTLPTPALALNGAAANGSTGATTKLPPAHDIRKVDADLPAGATALPKKGLAAADEWLAGAGPKKAKKGRKPRRGSAGNSGEDEPAAAAPASQSLQLPLATLSALLQLEVAAPLSQSDIPATIEGLKSKQQWFQDNQAATTAKRIAAAQLKIARATDAVANNKPGSPTGRPAKKPAAASRRASAEADVAPPPATDPAGPSAEVDETAPDASEPVSTNGEAEPLSGAEKALVGGATDDA